jgi:hypothetical protein
MLIALGRKWAGICAEGSTWSKLGDVLGLAAEACGWLAGRTLRERQDLTTGDASWALTRLLSPEARFKRLESWHGGRREKSRSEASPSDG